MPSPTPTSIRLRSKSSVALPLRLTVTCPTRRWLVRPKNCFSPWTLKKAGMPGPDRGSVWIVDLGTVAKVRPCLVLSVPIDPQDCVLVTLVPRTTSVQGTRFEVAAQARFLHPGGVFDAQQLVTVPQVKLI